MTFLTVTIPKHAHVLLLEDSEMRINWFCKRLPDVHVCRTVKEFRDYVESKPLIDYIFFDHDLGEGENGLDAAKYLVDKFGGTNNWALIHSWNRAGATAMQNYGLNAPHIPFGEFELEIDDARDKRDTEDLNTTGTLSSSQGVVRERTRVDDAKEPRLRSEHRPVQELSTVRAGGDLSPVGR